MCKIPKKFSVIHNKRSGKSCAAGIRLLKKAEKNVKEETEEKKEIESKRPERLKMRLSLRNSESNKEESLVIRQPKGPEAQGQKVFISARIKIQTMKSFFLLNMKLN